MGKMKDFGFWLSECVDQRHMSDEAIKSTFAARYPGDGTETSGDWLLGQIQSVKANPKQFGLMVNQPDIHTKDD